MGLSLAHQTVSFGTGSSNLDIHTGFRGAIALYLQDFAHKAPVTFDLFAIAVIITAIISLLIIIGKFIKLQMLIRQK